MKNKNKIGIIGGGNLYHLSFLEKVKVKNLTTPYGRAFYYLINNCPLILRHGPNRNIPPHKVNHQANISVFKKLGVKYIFAFNSVGSLKKSIKPGEFLIPHDYINFNSPSFYNKQCKHVTPEISPKLRKTLTRIFKKLKFDVKNKGIYFQTKGPRFETKAEVNLIKNFANVVGMTMSNEATLSKELNLEYASTCCVDNYANGVIKTPLTQELIKKCELRTNKRIEKIIQEILKLKSLTLRQ